MKMPDLNAIWANSRVIKDRATPKKGSKFSYATRWVPLDDANFELAAKQVQLEKVIEENKALNAIIAEAKKIVDADIAHVLATQEGEKLGGIKRTFSTESLLSCLMDIQIELVRCPKCGAKLGSISDGKQIHFGCIKCGWTDGCQQVAQNNQAVPKA
jgi:hypothetical protein